MKKLSIIYQSIDALKPRASNPRTHSKKQVQQLANSIERFGFTNPVLVDDTNAIIAGHGRLMAAKQLGMSEVPTVRLSNMTEAEIRAYVIADNRLAENAGWDDDLLRIELQYLTEINFDIELIGFETAEIDIILDGNEIDDNNAADEVPDIDENAAPITKLGDMWQLGKHRLICGDSTNSETYQNLMGADKAQAIFTDPPYNVAIDGHVCGNGKVKHREFAMASGEMSETEFTNFLSQFIKLSIEYSNDGSLHYICMDWRHMYELIGAGRTQYSELKNICVWNKQNGGMGSLYRSKHELVAVFKNGTKPHINNIELGQHGRYRTNVWDYAGVNSFGKNQSDLKLHPTVKPVAMIADAIKDCTKRNQIVLDPFAGSGSTLIACEESQRIARCIELDPLYCDVIIKRWQKLTGKNAVQAKTGMTFAQLATQQAEIVAEAV